MGLRNPFLSIMNGHYILSVYVDYNQIDGFQEWLSADRGVQGGLPMATRSRQIGLPRLGLLAVADRLRLSNNDLAEVPAGESSENLYNLVLPQVEQWVEQATENGELSLAYMKTYIDFMRVPMPASVASSGQDPYELALANDDGCYLSPAIIRAVAEELNFDVEDFENSGGTETELHDAVDEAVTSWVFGAYRRGVLDAAGFTLRGAYWHESPSSATSTVAAGGGTGALADAPVEISAPAAAEAAPENVGAAAVPSAAAAVVIGPAIATTKFPMYLETEDGQLYTIM